MHKLKFLTISIVLLMLLAVAGPSFDVSARPLADTTPNLGTANGFAVLAGTTVTDLASTSTIDGDLGLDPGGGAAIADTQCTEEMVAGSTIYDNNAGYDGNGGVGGTGCLVTDDPFVSGAKAALTVAYDRLIATDNATCDRDIPAVDDLSLLSPLGPGVYCATAFIITGNLVLAGAATDIWIFRSASTIDTDPNITVSGPASCSIWWRAVDSVTIGTGNTFIGNILALNSITDDGGSTISGRFLARDAAVNLNDTTITRGPLCASMTTGAAVPPAARTASGTGERERPNNAVSGLPNTGGAPIQDEDFPWNLVIVGGISVIALGLGVRAYRRTHISKQ